MKTLLDTLKENIESFQKDATLQLEKGIKIAGQRARKISLSIEKELKNFRKKSINFDKNKEKK
jgi:hypothetical protein